MKDTIDRLSRLLTLDEYTKATALFSAMIAEGIPTDKAAAMCYRAGYRQAMTDDRARRKRYHAERLERERQAAACKPAIIIDAQPLTPKEKLIAGYDVLSFEELQSLDTSNDDKEATTNE